MIYLDHSATTPTDPRVVNAMLPYFTDVYGNVSSRHHIGRQALQAVQKARETVARILNCQPNEIIFTSGGSESDNLALRGVIGASSRNKRHIITTPIEHGAIGKTALQLAEQQDADYSLLPVDQNGQVSPDDLENAIRPDTALLSVMYANNEIGTIQPIAALARIAHEHGILVHTDAVQAAGQLPLDVQALGVDLLSLSAHKFYGPKGIGVLYVRDGVEILPSQTGGGQEQGLRAGTQATPLIVGLAKALQFAYDEFDARLEHYRHIRDYLIDRVLTTIPNAILTGHPSRRLPTHASFVFEGISGGTLVDILDSRGVAASSASACKAGSHDPSAVLLALGYDAELASSSLRLTIGTQTTQRQIDSAVNHLAYAVNTLRQFAAV